jgi:hypothetical protein
LQIQELLRKQRMEIERRIQELPAVPPSTQAIYLARSPAGGIDGMAGDTPGSAWCTVLLIAPDGDVQVATTKQGDDLQVEAYNVSQSAVGGDTIIQLKQELASGRLLVDFEDCGSGT